MTDATVTLTGRSVLVRNGVVTAYSLPSSPIPDGSYWYRTGKIIAKVWTDSLSDTPVTTQSLVTHLILTGQGTVWKGVVSPGDVFEIDGQSKQFEIAKVISDTQIKIRIKTGDVNSIPALSEGGTNYTIIPLGQRTGAQVSSQAITLLQLLQKRDAEITDWVTGTKTGGPLSNGTYPISGVDGVVRYIPSPASLVADAGVVSEYDHKKWNGAILAIILTPVLNTTTNTWSVEIPFYSSAERVYFVNFAQNVSSCKILIKGQSSEENPNPLFFEYTAVGINNLCNHISAKIYFTTNAPNGTVLEWPVSNINSPTRLLWSFGYIPNFIPNTFSNNTSHNMSSFVSVCMDSFSVSLNQGVSDHIFARIEGKMSV